MAAIFADLGDAIATELTAAAGSFGQAYTAERSYADWDEKLEEMGVLHVDVVPVIHSTSELETRGSIYYEIEVDIGIRKRFDTADQDGTTGRILIAKIDELALLVEQVFEHLCELELPTFTADHAWIETKIRQTFVRKHLRENRQFTGLLRTKYRVAKNLP